METIKEWEAQKATQTEWVETMSEAIASIISPDSITSHPVHTIQYLEYEIDGNKYCVTVEAK